MRKIIALAVAGVSSGCGTHLPELATKSDLPMKVLVAKIDCEFQEAVWYQLHERGRDLITWQAAYTLTLKGNEIGSLKALTNTFPFTLSKLTSMNLGVGGGLTTTANRTAILKFNINFRDLKNRPVCAYAATGHPFLSGGIGLHDWLDDALSGFDQSANKVTSVGHTFQFTVGASGSISPGFVIGPTPTIGLNPSASQERVEDNSVDVVLSKAVPVTETVAQVIARTSAAQIAEMEKIRQEIEDLRKKNEETDKKIGENKAGETLSSRQLKFNLPNINSLRVDPDAGVTPQSKEELRFLVETQKNNDAELKKKTDKLTFLQNHPDVTTTTVNRRAGIYYSADQNPNILATQQQLTLERLNNTLRLNIP
ncbi:hypothetical protein AB7714_05750 [Tardiphaga sp. 1201_B9_N1_1]|uniref:hypothetical protein n=1 Tax=unclassified Tardiphaga TaxID=2631404 RepID=UPI003F20135E